MNRPNIRRCGECPFYNVENENKGWCTIPFGAGPGALLGYPGPSTPPSWCPLRAGPFIVALDPELTGSAPRRGFGTPMIPPNPRPRPVRFQSLERAVCWGKRLWRLGPRKF